jgi:hypothetical protein
MPSARGSEMAHLMACHLHVRYGVVEPAGHGHSGQSCLRITALASAVATTNWCSADSTVPTYVFVTEDIVSDMFRYVLHPFAAKYYSHWMWH